MRYPDYRGRGHDVGRKLSLRGWSERPAQWKKDRLDSGRLIDVVATGETQLGFAGNRRTLGAVRSFEPPRGCKAKCRASPACVLRRAGVVSGPRRKPISTKAAGSNL